MKIPLIEKLPLDGFIIDGPHMLKEHYYKTALLNSLIELRPTVCLEIGTLFGGTVKIFERYFDEYMHNGVVVTVDVKFYKDLSSPRVHQVQTYPHVEKYWDLHNITPADILLGGDTKWPMSVELNTAILRACLADIGAEKFDFAFIDGDHRKASAEKDIAIARALTVEPHFILLEDVREGLHEVSRYYAEEVSKQWNHYDFEDWPILSGTALIWDLDVELPLEVHNG